MASLLPQYVYLQDSTRYICGQKSKDIAEVCECVLFKNDHISPYGVLRHVAALR